MNGKIKGKKYRNVVRRGMLNGADKRLHGRHLKSWMSGKYECYKAGNRCRVTKRDRIRNERIGGTTKMGALSEKFLENVLKCKHVPVMRRGDHSVGRRAIKNERIGGTTKVEELSEKFLEKILKCKHVPVMRRGDHSVGRRAIKNERIGGTTKVEELCEKFLENMLKCTHVPVMRRGDHSVGRRATGIGVQRNNRRGRSKRRRLNSLRVRSHFKKVHLPNIPVSKNMPQGRGDISLISPAVLSANTKRLPHYLYVSLN